MWRLTLHSKSLLHLSSDLPLFHCTITLLRLLFVHPSQLPPSHPTAPPEHLKEPLAYMRKAQVSLSALISVTPASTTDLTLCSILQFHSCCFSSGLHWYYLQPNVPLCLFFLTQASWEKRVLKSLNSMSSELDVPLARMVPQSLSITRVVPTAPNFFLSSLSCCYFITA